MARLALDMVDKIDGIDAVDFKVLIEVGREGDFRRIDFKQFDERLAQNLLDLLPVQHGSPLRAVDRKSVV